MAANISGFGLRVNLICIPTFPAGLNITQLANDTDPFDIPEIQIAERKMGLNGDLIINSVSNPIDISLAVVANTPDDQSLGRLFNANFNRKGKVITVQDLITMTAIYPDGSSLTLINGILMSGMLGQSVASGGGFKTKVYKFTFEGNAGVP
jgi:hypothetical protein